MSSVIVYTTRACGYCVRAKQLLQSKQIPFQEVDISGDHAARAELVRSTGHRTVPQIFIGGRFIGGYDELAALSRSGQLDALLAAPPA